MRLACSILVSLFVGAQASATTFSVEEWSATWSGSGGKFGPFTASDDFEDGVAPAPPEYLITYGSVAPGDEAGGSFQIGGTSDPACQGCEAVGFNLGAGGEMSVLATYRFADPGLGQSYGVTISNTAGTDFATMIFARDIVPNFGERRFFAVIDENFPTVLSAQVAIEGVVAFIIPSNPTTLTMELRIVDTPSGLQPFGRYSFDGGPFFSLIQTPVAFGGAPDLGVLDRNDAHGAALFAIPEPRLVLLLLVALAAASARLRHRRIDGKA